MVDIQVCPLETISESDVCPRGLVKKNLRGRKHGGVPVTIACVNLQQVEAATHTSTHYFQRQYCLLSRLCHDDV